MRPTLLRSLAIVFVLPIVARAHVLLGYYLSDPLYRFSGIGTSLPGTFPGGATIDPNYGFVDQALTTRALHLLFSGELPWWNSLEGFGAPLAGEMQSSALFPFSPIVLLPNGNLLLNVLLGIFAGVAMLLLLRKLGLHAWPALVGAIALELCGTFSWLSGAWSYSIPWLPTLLLGIEYCRSASRREGRVGVLVVALSIAMLIYAGFIETSYLEGLVAIAWALARFAAGPVRERVAYVLRLVGAATIGLALAAPIIVAFADTLAVSFVGMHDSSGAGASLPPATLLQKILPYIYGPIFATRQAEVGSIWGNTGGYVGFVLGVVAAIGVFGNRSRGLRAVCTIVIVLGLAAILGGPLQHLLLLVPGVKYTAYYRYIDPSISFAACVLAAFAIDDALSLPNMGRRIGLAFVVSLGFVAFAYNEATQDIVGVTAAADADLAVWHTFSLWTVLVGSIAIGAAVVVRNGAARATILGFAVCLEAFVLLVIPTLSNPTGATIALGGVRYLRDHVGLQRFYSLGPLEPNYGSYFGVASLAYNDLPIPARTVSYIKENLDPLADAVNFLGNMPRPGMNQKDNFAQRVAAFERVGVGYVITPPGDPVPSPIARLKYRDLAMAVYQLPNPTPYFTAPGCRLEPQSRSELDATCNGPSSLCRLEVNVPGWFADIDARRQAPGDCGEIFEAVSLPAGHSHVTFRYTPPSESAATIAAAIGALFVVAISLTLLPRKRAFVPAV